MNDRWKRQRELFDAASRLPKPERRAFLEQECTDDSALIGSIEALLAEHDEDDGSLSPTIRAGAEALLGIPDQIGRYSVRGRIGEGAMGVVFEAQQENPRRDVALKVMRGGPFVDEARLKMFQREAETLARLAHPCIASIYESGHTADGQHFFAMERVRGEHLDVYMKRRPSNPDTEELRFRLALFRKIVDAVHYAHMRGVIHRDLKPSNLMVGENVDQQGLPEIKVLDFGLARITQSDMAAVTITTEIGVIKGTLPYMSPEQTRGHSDLIDVRTDVYALGVILYEMLTGRRPYETDRGELVDALRVICETTPDSLSRNWTGVRRLDADVETIVGKALEKEASRRYDSAAALSSDIERFLNNEAISARPASAAYQLRKLVSRHKAPFAFVAMLFVTISAFGVWMSVLYTQADRLRMSAVAAEQEQALARQEAEEARDTLETITKFQQSMLGEIDAQEMGRGIVAAEREGIREALESGGAGLETVGAALAAFDELLANMNATNLALKVVEEHVLARAVASIDKEFADQPLTRAAMQQTVADTYKKLGIYDPAIPLQQAALATHRKELGDDHPGTLASLNRLGSLLRRQGKLDEAMPYYSEALSGFRRVLGDDHPETLVSVNNMGLLLNRMEKYAEAEPYYREALSGNRRALGDDHPETLNSINNLGTLLHAQGKLDEAISYYREAMEGNRRALGDDHPKTLISINNMGAALQLASKPEEAARYQREALEGSRRVLGDDHPDTLRAIHNVGGLLNEIGQYDEAAQLLKRGEPAARLAWTGDFAKWFGSYLSRLGEAQNGLRMHRDAEATLLESHRLLAAGFGDHHERTLKATHQLIILYDARHAAEPGKGYDAKAVEWRAKLPQPELEASE